MPTFLPSHYLGQTVNVSFQYCVDMRPFLVSLDVERRDWEPPCYVQHRVVIYICFYLFHIADFCYV